ncbi:MAG: Rieske 2Fe-2S domain-containing protein [Burkholderiales bacterium]
MESLASRQERIEKLKLLPQTARGTPMGTLLRRFWHPVALARHVPPKRAMAIRILSEDLTLFQGESGAYCLVGARCAHRGTLLYPGWIEGDSIRCPYHGWRYAANGRCVERPAEKDSGNATSAIAGYPVRNYGGLLFAYLGEGAAPAFELPRKDVFESAGAVIITRAEKWPCNWFQMIENSMDATHVSFVHQLGTPGDFGSAVGQRIPELSYSETEAGIEQVATRGKGNVRKSDWTFPNNNHIVIPGLGKDDPWTDIAQWNVPHDDLHTTRFSLNCTHATGAAAERFVGYYEEFGDYNPADYHDELFYEGKFPEHPRLVSAQDYVATRGQGDIADRANEVLGRSDAGIVFLRNIFLRELDSIAAGQATKPWTKRPEAEQLPIPQV